MLIPLHPSWLWVWRGPQTHRTSRVSSCSAIGRNRIARRLDPRSHSTVRICDSVKHVRRSSALRSRWEARRNLSSDRPPRSGSWRRSDHPPASSLILAVSITNLAADGAGVSGQVLDSHSRVLAERNISTRCSPAALRRARMAAIRLAELIDSSPLSLSRSVLESVSRPSFQGP